MMVVRDEQPGDEAAVREVNRRAFGQDQEGALVDALRSNGAALLSLVATLDERVVGHILYSPARAGEVVGAALGPMAVLPEYQLPALRLRAGQRARDHVRMGRAGRGVHGAGA